MRTTLSLDDNLLAEAKRRARQRGVSVGAVVEDALRRAFTREKTTKRPEVPIFRAGTGVRPGIDLTSNRALLEALDEQRGVDSIR